MVDEEFPRSQVEALIAKFNAIDFTAEERTMLRSAFKSGAGEVEGFMDVQINQVSASVGSGSFLSPEYLAKILASIVSMEPQPHGGGHQGSGGQGLT